MLSDRAGMWAGTSSCSLCPCRASAMPAVLPSQVRGVLHPSSSWQPGGSQPRVPLLEWWPWGCTSEMVSPMCSPQVFTSFQVKRERKEMWVPRGPQVSGTSPWTEVSGGCSVFTVSLPPPRPVPLRPEPVQCQPAGKFCVMGMSSIRGLVPSGAVGCTQLLVLRARCTTG